jgi:hypothetical protein
MNPPRASIAIASLGLMTIPASASAQCTNGVAGVLTGQYDNARDSVNPDETCLTPTSSTFYGPDGVTPIFVQQAAFPTIPGCTGNESPSEDSHCTYPMCLWPE